MMLWFANRGTGVVLEALLTLATVLGVFATVRAGSARWPRFATQSLHRNVSLLAAALLLAHIATAVLDSFVDLTWYDALVPISGTYAGKHRIELALGSFALDLLLAVLVTSWARTRLSHGLWRAVHVVTYLAWAAGTVHGFLIGTDARTTWALGVTLGCSAAGAVVLLVRLGTWANERRRDALATGAIDLVQ